MPANTEELFVKRADGKGYSMVKGWKAVRNPAPDSDNRIVSVVTDSYQLITNEEVTNMISPVLEDAGFSLRREIDVSGRRHFWEWEFGSPFVVAGEAEDSEHGRDEFKLWVLVKNSYDRSSSLKFTGGFYRLVCSNGLMVGEAGMTARVIHAGNVHMDSRFKPAFEAFVSVHQAGIDVVRQLASNQKELSLLSAWEVLEKEARKLPKKYYPQAPKGTEPKDFKVRPYQVVMDVTYAVSHDDRLQRDQSIERRNYLLQQLSRAIPVLARA